MTDVVAIDPIYARIVHTEKMECEGSGVERNTVDGKKGIDGAGVKIYQCSLHFQRSGQIRIGFVRQVCGRSLEGQLPTPL